MAPQKITIWDRLYLFPHFARLILTALTRAVLRPVTGGKRPKSYFKDVVFAVLRAQVNGLNYRQEQWILPSTEQMYLDFAKQKGFQPDTDTLESGAKLHWLGSKSAEKVLLFFHGGGYSLPISDGHIRWVFDLQNAIAGDTSFSVVLLNYTLTPESQYPNQLRQAADGLAHLLGKSGKKPSNIIIGGDSAGGNMTLMLMSHLLHPHSDIASVDNLSEPLAGALLISPWAKFGVDDESVIRNAKSDMVTSNCAVRWGNAFLGGKSEDNYNAAALAPIEWFDGLDEKIKNIFVWGGEAEILIDSINLLTGKLEKAHPRVEYVTQEDAAHEDMIFDTALGYKAKAEGTKAMEKWIKTTV